MLDIDECDTSVHSCEVASTCTNTDGSYTCGCNPGKQLNNNGRTCAGINH